MKHHLPLLSLFLFLACDNAAPPAPVVPPSGLVITVTEGEGRAVEVSASATNANFYTVYFGEVAFASVKTMSGKAAYTYSMDGVYTIKVNAHATDDVFISETQEVEIALGDGIEIPAEGYTTPLSYDGMQLLWQDEFDGDVLDQDDWTHEVGTGSNGWGNNELQYYRPQNTTIKEGCLVITARRENYGGSEFTSSRIITQDKVTFQYGRVDIRAALPKGQGIWPALWMLGNNIGSVGWPSCGEIDIMEMIGGAGREKTVHGTVHWESNGHASYGNDHSLASGTYGDKFHVFSIEWTPTTITWYVDDVQFNVIDITPADLAEFHQSFFLIFNVAVGGNWPGSPDASTLFPQHLIVDYVRVFQHE